MAPIEVEVPLTQVEPTSNVVRNRLLEQLTEGVPSKVSSSRPSSFTRTIEPIGAERFANGLGDSGASIGGLALAVSPDGQYLYASGGSGRRSLYRFPLNDTASVTKHLLSTLEQPIYELAFDAAGQLWATSGGLGLLQLDPATGRVLESIGVGMATGIAAVPEKPR